MLIGFWAYRENPQIHAAKTSTLLLISTGLGADQPEGNGSFPLIQFVKIKKRSHSKVALL
jgi:hypothetical protein